MEFGKSLRAAREAKGLTIGQLAEQTRMAPRTIEMLEVEDLSHFAAPIYGRGFVKMYCEAVGLDPQPFIEEFMEIFRGNRDTVIRERPTSSVSEPPAEAPVKPAPPPAPQAELFDASSDDVSTAPLPQNADEPTLSRYATPVRQTDSPPLLSPSLWRIGVLALAALILVILIGISVRSLYRATTSTPAKQAPATEKASAPVRTPTAVPTAARTPQQLPSLYVD